MEADPSRMVVLPVIVVFLPDFDIRNNKEDSLHEVELNLVNYVHRTS